MKMSNLILCSGLHGGLCNDNLPLGGFFDTLLQQTQQQVQQIQADQQTQQNQEAEDKLWQSKIPSYFDINWYAQNMPDANGMYPQGTPYREGKLYKHWYGTKKAEGKFRSFSATNKINLAKDVRVPSFFDANWYLEKYPDVKSWYLEQTSYMQAQAFGVYLHWYGTKEAEGQYRPLNVPIPPNESQLVPQVTAKSFKNNSAKWFDPNVPSFFDEVFYLRNNIDWLRIACEHGIAVGQLYEHWHFHGRSENRKPNAEGYIPQIVLPYLPKQVPYWSGINEQERKILLGWDNSPNKEPVGGWVFDEVRENRIKSLQTATKMNALTKNNGGLGLNFEVPNFYDNINWGDSTGIDWNSEKWVSFQTQVCGQANAPGCELKCYWDSVFNNGCGENCDRRGEWNTCNDLSRIVWSARMAVVKASEKELAFFKEREKEVANATVQKAVDNSEIQDGTRENTASASKATNWILGLVLLGTVGFVGYKIYKRNQPAKAKDLKGINAPKKSRKKFIKRE